MKGRQPSGKQWDEYDRVMQCEVLTAESSTEFCCSDKFSSASHTQLVRQSIYILRGRPACFRVGSVWERKLWAASVSPRRDFQAGSPVTMSSMQTF